ncbi:MAG: hypothetical protein QOG59_1109 [Solirubrobacteraceae bacterium]|jgi:nucleotide-binding universal stress UspA family protein|nr:hypothetical protein [Solirubrobacteraceae bacterium]
MFHNILVAVDGSPDADLALDHAIDLARSQHSKLTLITAVVTVPATAYLGMNGLLPPMSTDPRTDAQKVIRAAAERVPDDQPVTTVLSEAPIRLAILRQVKEGHHDLVVMGSRGRGALRSAALGSVSHSVLNHSPAPVLIVHAQARPRPDHEVAGSEDHARGDEVDAQSPREALTSGARSGA